jgi:hypothetical protein
MKPEKLEVAFWFASCVSWEIAILGVNKKIFQKGIAT